MTYLSITLSVAKENIKSRELLQIAMVLFYWASPELGTVVIWWQRSKPDFLSVRKKVKAYTTFFPAGATPTNLIAFYTIYITYFHAKSRK